VTYASSRITIDASADAIWQVIGDFGAACEYLAMVVDCTVVGQGIGALRTLTSSDGSTIVERLETLDEVFHRLSYVLLTDTPFRNCLTTMKLRELGQSRSELEWSASFEADGVPAEEAWELLADSLAANCLALKQLLEG
jgi:hypothetical protein